MNILILSKHFYPENFKINDIVFELSKKKHNIIVVTSKPCYPGNKIFRGYSFLGLKKETINNIKIYRLPTLPRFKDSFFYILLNYLFFMVNTFFYLPFIIRGKSISSVLVFGTSPCIQALGALPSKFLFNLKVNVWIQDLWPFDFKSNGYLNNRLVFSVNIFLINIVYKYSDVIFLQSRFFKKKISPQFLSKCRYLPNPLDSYKNNFYYDMRRVQKKLSRIDKKTFNIGFTGNIGKAQSIPLIVEVAKKLKDENITFYFFGAGSMLNYLKSRIKSEKVFNIKIMGQFPNASMPLVFKKLDACIVTLISGESTNFTLPAKVQSAMLASKPIVASGSFELKRIIKEAKCGFYSEAEDLASFYSNIIKIKKLSHNERLAMGKSGYKFANKEFNFDSIVLKIEKSLVI